jgi:hypothetical protein
MILTVLTLTGCSELQVIGRAALHEQSPGGINTEWALYTQRNMVPPTAKSKRTVIAKSELNVRAARDAATREQPKGQWERH